MENEKNLPSLVELHQDAELAFKNDKLNLLLNQPPHEKWVKRHPVVTVKNDKGEFEPLRYLPVDKHEYLLTRIFQSWKLEILSVTALFNSVCAIVRVHYKNPVTGEWSFHDGVGAAPVQTDKGSSAADLSKIKNAAIQMAAPSAVSYALKDSCEHFGKLFGRDLSRRGTVKFKGAYGEKDETETTAPSKPASGEEFDFEL